MKPTKILAAVGANDETIAHLRLLLRMGATRLRHDWHWGTELEADFVVVEPGTLAADTIQTHCQAAGIPFAVMCEQNAVVVQGMALRRPLKLDQIVAVFDAAGASSAGSAEVQAFGDDFYTTQHLGEDVPTGSDAADVWAAHERNMDSAPRPRSAPVQDLDHLLYGDPLAEPVELGPLVPEGTEVDPIEQPRTARSERSRHNADERMAATLIGVSTVDVAPIVPQVRGMSPAAAAAAANAAAKRARENPTRPLPDFLESHVVASPTQLRVEDAPVLTLDPKHRHFHAAGPLQGLAALVERGVMQDQVATVAGSELARVRLTEPGRSYDELRWLVALLQSSGTLSSRLDPGGTYCVREALVLDPEYRHHGAVVAALRAPSRLHEAAQMSGAPMGDVFDIVNAYDAIGRLEWTPRAPRQSSEPAKPAGAGGSRLKWPFGRK